MRDKKVTVGGQAVVEGVMMRGPKAIATAVRKQDGSIVYKKIALTEKSNKWLKVPFVRGVIALYDAMVVGTKEAIGGFFFKDSVLKANIVEAVIKLVLFLGYIYGISFLKDIQRVFEYHGAEHKSIMNYEMEKELSPKNAKVCTRFHPRCGTSFLLLVMFISILVFSTVDLFFKVPTGHFSMIIYKLVTRILFVPFVAGLSYEIQRWTSYHLDNIFAKMIAVPGMWLQKITTREPDESQLEVAIVALNVALGNEVPNATEVFE